MILTITYKTYPASDLGYLLHKNPNRPQTVDTNYGKAHIFYTDVSDTQCTAVLLLDIDPIDLARGRRGPDGGGLFDYVNDRPYVCSSFMSVALARAFGTAMTGRSKEKPYLAEKELEFIIRIVMLPCSGGEDIIKRLFEPLGYEVTVEGFMLDEEFPEWGQSRFYNVNLKGNIKLRDMLNHLYVLMPVMDSEKHYWIGEDEINKLLRHGEGWLNAHPERNLITSRYLNRKRSLINKALERLVGEEQVSEDEDTGGIKQDEKKLNLNQKRLGAVVSVLKSMNAKSVIDLGCGEGNLLSILVKDSSFEKIAGMDVSYTALERAKDRLHLDRMMESKRSKIELFQGSLTYRDKRISGYDAAAVIEVIEHLDNNRLSAFEEVLFRYAKPKTIIISTPNVEYNINYENLNFHNLRHKDHRFEWTRQQFENWASDTAKKYGYSVRFVQIGDIDGETGAPTQMGVFTL